MNKLHNYDKDFDPLDDDFITKTVPGHFIMQKFGINQFQRTTSQEFREEGFKERKHSSRLLKTPESDLSDDDKSTFGLITQEQRATAKLNKEPLHKQYELIQKGTKFVPEKLTTYFKETADPNNPATIQKL